MSHGECMFQSKDDLPKYSFEDYLENEPRNVAVPFEKVSWCSIWGCQQGLQHQRCVYLLRYFFPDTYLSVCLYACLSVCLSVYPFVHPSNPFCVCLLVFLRRCHQRPCAPKLWPALTACRSTPVMRGMTMSTSIW